MISAFQGGPDSPAREWMAQKLHVQLLDGSGTSEEAGLPRMVDVNDVLSSCCVHSVVFILINLSNKSAK